MLPLLSITLLVLSNLASTTTAFSSSSTRISTVQSSIRSTSLPVLHAASSVIGMEPTTSDTTAAAAVVQQEPMPAGAMVTPVVVINSPQELAEFLNQDDRVTVIKFHAAWCKSCQKFGLKFQGLSRDKTDWVDKKTGAVVNEGAVRFASIEFGANTPMCKGLGIKRLPTVHMYQKGIGRLEGFPCGPKKFALLLAKLEYHIHRSHSKRKEQDFDTIMQQGEELMASTAAALTATGSSSADVGVAEKLGAEEITGILDHLMEQDASRVEESSTHKGSSETNKKSILNLSNILQGAATRASSVVKQRND